MFVMSLREGACLLVMMSSVLDKKKQFMNKTTLLFVWFLLFLKPSMWSNRNKVVT